MEPITQLGMQVAGQAASAGMGMLLGNYNDRRQLKQQRELQELQMKGMKEMRDYDFAKQLEMWKATNYEAQKREMEKAGLNPALLYGMKGGGAVTTGSSGGGPSGAQAPVGGGEIQSAMGMGLQTALQAAQIELIKAQTNKTNVEATKTGGVDTEETKSRIASLSQGVTESKAKVHLTNIVSEIQALELRIKNSTQEEAIHAIEYSTGKLFRELQMLDDAQYVSHATRLTRADIIREELTSITLNNSLTKEKINLTKAEIQEIATNIDVMLTKLDIDWQSLRIAEQEMYIKSYVAKTSAAAIPMQTLMQAVGAVALIRNSFPTKITTVRKGNTKQTVKE